MSDIANALSPYFFNDLVDVKCTDELSFKNWLLQSNVVLSSYINDPAQKHKSQDIYKFFTPQSSMIVKSLAFDINRMSSASFESIFSVKDYSSEMPRSTAWPIIKAYYSAFFAAHALIRFFGVAVIQLDKSQTLILNKAMSYHATPPTANITDGLYQVNIDSGGTNFTIQKLKNGSHEDTWYVFSEVMHNLANNILKNVYLDSAAQQSSYLLISDILKELKTSSKSVQCNRLSTIRNEINYRHLYGTWHPHTRSNSFRKEIYSNVSKWKKRPELLITPKTHILDGYTQTCAAIISICRELVEELNRIDGSNNSFLKNGAIKVIKQCKK